MLIDCGLYRGGKRDEGVTDVAGSLAQAEGPHAFVWIGLHDPTAEEIAEASAEFGLHELLLEDVVNAHQRAKSERFDTVDFVVLKSASYTSPDLVTIGEVQFIIGASFVITIRHGDALPLAPVRRRLEADHHVLALGPAAVVYAVADALVDAYADVVEELEIDVDEAEAQVFSDDRLNPAERIYGLKRQVLELLRNVLPVADVLQDIQTPGGVHLDPALEPYVRDVEDHLQRILSRMGLVRDLLSDALNANLAQVGVRQNDDMRTISAWAALIAAPTMLAGIWGMNFRSMPELDWFFGYPVALGSMVLAVVVLWVRFKRSGWL